MDVETGVFRLGALPPGEYRVRTGNQTFPSVQLGTHVLSVGQELDLGLIRLPVEAKLAVALQGDWQKADKPVVVVLDEMGDVAATCNIQEGLARPLTPLAAGRYAVQATGLNVAALHRMVELRAGQETRIKVSLDLATPCRVRFLLPDGAVVPARTRVTVTSAGQHPVLETTVHGRWLSEGLATGLRPGRYRIEARCDGGLLGIAQALVTREPAEIEVRLR